MKNNLKIKLTNGAISGSFFDSHLLNDSGDTVYFIGEYDGDEVWLLTSDSLGERESLSVNLKLRDNSGLVLKERKRKITVKEGIEEVLRFKTFNQFE